MINFFRKTRKKLADDNKPIKYMRYAIGEIALVVVGILIALSINNWNEFNKSYKNTINNLNQVKYELGQDINFFKDEISYSKWVVKYFNHIKLKEFDSVFEEYTFIRVTSNLTSPDLSRSYNKLNESGNIDIINDSILTSSLHDYFLEERNIYSKYASYNAGFTSDKIEGYLLFYLELDENLKTTETSVINELDNGKLINLINYQSHVYEINKEMSENMIEKAEKIIKLINEEVNN